MFHLPVHWHRSVAFIIFGVKVWQAQGSQRIVTSIQIRSLFQCLAAQVMGCEMPLPSWMLDLAVLCEGPLVTKRLCVCTHLSFWGHIEPINFSVKHGPQPDLRTHKLNLWNGKLLKCYQFYCSDLPYNKYYMCNNFFWLMLLISLLLLVQNLSFLTSAGIRVPYLNLFPLWFLF